MEILFFGGAFDPVHNGHTAILKSAMEYKKFDKVIVMPTGLPSHKDSCKAPFEIRKHMARLVFRKINENIEVSSYEGNCLEKNYSYKTIDRLKEKYPGSNIYFIIGSDSAINIKTWANWEYLAKNVIFLVFAREFNQESELGIAIEEIKKFSPKTTVITNDIIPVSSTEIRKKAAIGENIDDFVDSDIAKIIMANNLYSRDFYKRNISIAEMLVPMFLRRKRAIHTYNVEKLATELAQIHGVDVNKAKLAAVLHDIMKQRDKKEVWFRAIRSDDVDRVMKKNYPVIHGFAAADYAKEEMGIEDEEILEALKNHTCARKNMCELEKVIYLADMLCEGRSFPSRDYLLSIARKDLNLAMERALKSSISWLKEKEETIDIDSYEALEYFEKLNNGGNVNVKQ